MTERFFPGRNSVTVHTDADETRVLYEGREWADRIPAILGGRLDTSTIKAAFNAAFQEHPGNIPAARAVARQTLGLPLVF